MNSKFMFLPEIFCFGDYQMHNAKYMRVIIRRVGESEKMGFTFLIPW